MVKLNSPLLSLDAHGTVGNAVTFQSSTKRKFAREKPRLPYSLTLSQQYQRWLYEDYCRRWHAQSLATKNQYRDDGLPYRLTAFQYWMRYQLRNLPDIVCGYRMDRIGGAVVPDFSRNTIDLTKFGATYADGLIAQSLYFDGVNDYLQVAGTPLLTPTPAFSFTLFWKPLDTGAWHWLIGRNHFASKDNAYQVLYLCTTKTFYFYIGDGAAPQTISLAPFDFNEYHAISCGVDGSFLYLYVDEIQATPVAQVITPTQSLDPLRIGLRSDGSQDSKGNLDHLILRNRMVSYEEHLIFARRRYSV